MKKKISAMLLAVIMLLSWQATALPSSAAETITETLDIAGLNKNGSGAGYNWANIDGILTLDGLRIETKDDYGLKLPEGATVVLNGDNYIKASECAIRCVASLTIQGNGTLTLISDDTAVFCGSNVDRDTVRFRSGKITISGCETGVYAEHATVAFTGADVTLNAKSYSVRAKNIQMSGGNVTAVGKLSAKADMSLSGVNLTANGTAPVLSAGNKLDISSCDIFCGADEGSLTASEGYTDTATVKLVSTVDTSRKGVLFGGKYPLAVDYIVFTLLGLITVAVIAVPIYIKSKKTKKLIAEHQAMLNKNKKAPKKK